MRSLGIGLALSAIVCAGLGTIVSERYAHAQYQPIPNYTGVGAGQQFRDDINNHLSGVTPIAPVLVPLNFASLSATPEQDGQLYWCRDCLQAPVCTNGGGGALALGSGGEWTCNGGATASGPPTGTAGHDLSGSYPNPTVASVLNGQTPVTTNNGLNALANATGNYSMSGYSLLNLAALTPAQVTDTIAGFNINGEQNPLAPVYGAVSSAVVGSVSTSASSPSVALTNGAGDWVNGQDVALVAAGPTATLAAPAWCTATTCGSSSGHNYPLFETQGATGSTSYSYCVETVDQNNGISACGPIATVTNAQSMLGPASWVQLEWAAVSGAQGYIANSCRGTGCTPKFLKYIPADTAGGQNFQGAADVGLTYAPPEFIGIGNGVTNSFSTTLEQRPFDSGTLTVTTGAALCTDNGIGSFSGAGCGGGSINYGSGAITVSFTIAPAAGTNIWAVYTPTSAYPVRLSGPTRDWVFTTIQSGGGTVSLTLNSNSAVSTTTTMVHDNWTPIQSTLNALGASGSTPAGGTVKLQRGTYSLPKPLMLPSEVTLKMDCGGTNYGIGGAANGYVFGTTLQWTGPDGMDMIDVYDGLRQQILCGNLDARNINGAAAPSTAMTGIHLDTSLTFASGDDKAKLEQVSINGAHHGFEIGGNIIVDGEYPSGDVSEFVFEQTHTAFPQNDARSMGYVVNSTNAGYPISMLAEPSCLGAPNVCIAQIADGGLYVDRASGSVVQGPTPAFHVYDVGLEGTITHTEYEGNNGSYCLRVEPTASVTGSSLGGLDFVDNACNGFGNGITLDAPITVLSKNNAFGSTPPSTLQANSPGAVVYSESDGAAWSATATGGTIEHTMQNQNSATNVEDSFGRLVIAPSINQNALYGMQLRFMDPQNSHYNWLFGCDVNINNACEITPSTTPGGATFTSPAVEFLSGGNAVLTQVPEFSLGLEHLNVSGVPTPAAPTAAVVGTTGSTSYGPYFLVCHDWNGGITAVSAASNIVTNGPSALSSSNYIQVSWTGTTGCASWDVLKGTTATSVTTGLPSGATAYQDVGGATSTYAPPTRNTTGDVVAGTLVVNGNAFASLPTSVVNGSRTWCSNCDPPANPPVTCTSSGAKTGAFADGVNNKWICTY